MYSQTNIYRSAHLLTLHKNGILKKLRNKLAPSFPLFPLLPFYFIHYLSATFRIFSHSLLNFHYLTMDAYDFRTQCRVGSKHHLGSWVPLSTLVIFAHQVIHLLPDGHMLGMWVLHSRIRTAGIDIGKQITICRGQGELGGIWSRPIATAIITGIAYCDKEQINFCMKIEGYHNTSLLSMPVSCTSINCFRKLLYWLVSIGQPSPPSLSQC